MIVLPSISSGVISSSLSKIFDPKKISGLALWLKADAGVTLGTYVSQIALTCTGGFSSYSGTYNATSAPDIDGAYSLFCSANSKTIYKDGFGSGFTIGPDFPLASSGDGISWSLENVLVAGITIDGSDDADANGAYGLNERNQSTANLVNDNGYNLNTNTSGVCEIYAPDNVTLLYSNSSNGSGTWTNEGGTGDVTASSIQLDPSGTVSGSITTSPISIVTAWADQSGNGKNATSVINPTYTASAKNGKPAITFSGAELMTTANIFNGANARTMFAAYYVDNDETPNTICGQTNDVEVVNGSFFLLQARSDQDGNPYLATANDDLAGSPFVNQVWKIAMADYDGTTANLYSNGTNVGTNTFSWNTHNGTFCIGSYFTNDDPNSLQELLVGQVAEIVAYNRVLTTTERQQVEAYLNSKYAIY